MHVVLALASRLPAEDPVWPDGLLLSTAADDWPSPRRHFSGYAYIASSRLLDTFAAASFAACGRWTSSAHRHRDNTCLGKELLFFPQVPRCCQYGGQGRTWKDTGTWRGRVSSSCPCRDRLSCVAGWTLWVDKGTGSGAIRRQARAAHGWIGIDRMIPLAEEWKQGGRGKSGRSGGWLGWLTNALAGRDTTEGEKSQRRRFSFGF